MQRVPLLAMLVCFLLAGSVPTASAQVCCDNLETLGPDGTPVNTLVIGGITVTITSGTQLVAATYGVGPAGFTGTGLNTPLNPGNVSGAGFITTNFAASGGFNQAQPITFTFSAPVTYFSLTTLDLLETTETGGPMTLQAPAAGGLDADTRGAPQGASGIEINWQVSSAASFMSARLLANGALTQNGFGIDDICLVPVTPCGSTASSAGGNVVICPAGDAGNFPNPIAIRLLDASGAPIPNVPRCDFWLVDCDPVDDMVLCTPAQLSTNAFANTDAWGDTQMLGPISGGGCADGLSVVVQGQFILDPATGCSSPLCLPFTVRSPDINGDLLVSIQDVALFAQNFVPNPYGKCSDFNGDGTVGIQDVAILAMHFGHGCIVPSCT